MTAPADRERFTPLHFVICVAWAVLMASTDERILSDRREISAIAADHGERKAYERKVMRIDRLWPSADVRRNQSDAAPAVNVTARGGIEGPVQPTDRRRGHPQSGSIPAGSTTTVRGGAQQEDAWSATLQRSIFAVVTTRTAFAQTQSSEMGSSASHVNPESMSSSSSRPHVVDNCLPALPLIVSGDYVQCVDGLTWTLNPENNMPRLRVRAVKEDAWAEFSARVRIENRATGTPLGHARERSIIPATSATSVDERASVSANSASIYCAALTSLPLADLRAGDLVYISNDGTRYWITADGDSCPPPMNIVFGVCGTFDGTSASMKGCGVTVTPTEPPGMSAYVSDPRPDAGFVVTLPDIVRDPVLPGTNDVTCAFERSGSLLQRAENVSLLVNGTEAKTFTVAAGEDWSAVTIARPKVEPFSLTLKGADWQHSCGWLMLRQVGVTP